MAKAEELVSKTDVAVEEAARQVKISGRTVRAHRARAGKSAKLSPPKPLAPASSPAGTEVAALPQGGAVSGRPDLLELVRRILDARNGAARAELDEGLRVQGAGDAEAFERWLARPIAAVEIDADELATLRDGLGVAVGVSRTAEPGGAQLRALTIVERLGKTIATVKARRPPVDGPDVATARILAARAAAIERIGILTSEAAARFTAKRADLDAWCAPLGAFGVEIKGRVDAVLGGTAT